jgi:hypothetical protein
LTDRRGSQLGRVIVLYDITEVKRARERFLEQQRALATLQERERVARELHDSLGQVLGYVKMQAQAARGLLAQNESAEADPIWPSWSPSHRIRMPMCAVHPRRRTEIGRRGLPPR